MEELLKTIVLALVDSPDEISVSTVKKDGETILELRVAGDDMGKVIGKQGRIAKAIRVVVKASGSKENTNYGVEIGQ